MVAWTHVMFKTKILNHAKIIIWLKPTALVVMKLRWRRKNTRSGAELRCTSNWNSCGKKCQIAVNSEAMHKYKSMGVYALSLKMFLNLFCSFVTAEHFLHHNLCYEVIGIDFWANWFLKNNITVIITAFSHSVAICLFRSHCYPFISCWLYLPGRASYVCSVSEKLKNGSWWCYWKKFLCCANDIKIR